MNQVAKSLETIFAKAIEIASPENRRIFLDQACEGDPELRHSVEKLVGHHVRAGSSLAGLCRANESLGSRPRGSRTAAMIERLTIGVITTSTRAQNG